MRLDRITCKRLRLAVLSAIFFATYIAMFRTQVNIMDQLPQHLSQDNGGPPLESPLLLSPSSKSNQSQPSFYYTSPNFPRLKGKPFSVSEKALKELRLLPKNYINLTSETVQKFVFATAASFAFFELVKDAIVTVQTHRPDDVIYVYDLGMTRMQAHEIRSMCKVNYRKFGFSLFPKHVGKKFLYAWKPLVLVDVLSRHPGVFWMDSSVRLTTGDFKELLGEALTSGGALSLTTTGHSTFAATDPAMYAYLPPGDATALRREEQREATLLMYRTESIINQVLKWMVLCALDVHCIAPSSARRGCVWKGSNHFVEYGNCHRYDQSAFNILMLNYHKCKSSSKYYATSRVCEIERFTRGESIPKYCDGDKSKEDLE